MAAGFRNAEGKPAAPPFTNGPYEMDQHVDFQKTALDSSTRYTLVENFNRKPQANADIEPGSADDGNDGATKAEIATMVACNFDFEVLGTGASSDDVTFGTDHGGLLLTTDSSASQQVIILPHLDTGQTAWTDVVWGTENQVIWEAVIRTGASVADIVIWAGLKLTNTSAVATDADQAFFRFDAGVANWEATYSIAGTDTETDTGVVVAASTNYYFKIEIDSSRIAHFYINGEHVAQSTALTDDINLIPYIGVEGNAKTLHVIKEKISRIIYE